MEGKKKTASGTEKEAALAELDRVERELAELGPDPALEADKKSNAVLDKGKTRPLKEVKYPVAVSASELKKMEIPQIVWIVDRLLPVGVSMIGAPSKYFKSYMALGLCLAVCTGEKFLSFQCNKLEIANVGNVKQWLSEMGIRTVEPLLTEQIVISGRKRGGIFINESRLCSLILSSWTLINLATKQRRV